MDTKLESASTSNLLSVDVEAVAFGGKGIAKLDGKVLFIPDTVPGDKVRVRIVKDHKKYADAVVEAITTPSPLRQASPCRYSSSCGGCQWQDIPYEKQLEWKQNFIRDAFRRIAKLPQIETVAVTPSPSIQHYRNRIHLKVESTPSGIEVGYYKSGTRTLVPIQECKIATAEINKALQQLNPIKIPDLPPSYTFRLELQRLLDPKSGMPIVTAVIFPDRDFDPSWGDKIAEQISSIAGIDWAGSIVKQKSFPEFLLMPSFWTKPGVFQQVNLDQNLALREIVKKLVKNAAPSRVLDLFCGSGNFSQFLSDSDIDLEGVEIGKEAIQLARKNRAGKQGVYHVGDAEKHLWNCVKRGETFDLILTDPPREGMLKCLKPLVALKPDTILYVSCNPTTLARDVGRLVKEGYELNQLQGFDFFPNTYHVETLAVLKKV